MSVLNVLVLDGDWQSVQTLDISLGDKLAFISALKDPQLEAEAKKAKIGIDPIDGPGIEKIVNGLIEIEPAVVSRVKQILDAK